MHLLLVWSTAVLTIQFRATCNEVRIKRGSQDVFNVLLNLYKIQPLKSSKIYKIFADRVLLPNHIDNTDHLYSNENAKEKPLKARLDIREIEKLIQASSPNIDHRIDPHFNVENVGSEKFTINIIFNDTMKVDSEVNNNNMEKVVKTEDNLSSILYGLESGESSNDTHITEEVPVIGPIMNINYTPVTIINEVTPFYAANNFTDSNMNVRPISVNQYANEIVDNYENADVIVI